MNTGNYKRIRLVYARHIYLEKLRKCTSSPLLNKFLRTCVRHWCEHWEYGEVSTFERRVLAYFFNKIQPVQGLVAVTGRRTKETKIKLVLRRLQRTRRVAIQLSFWNFESRAKSTNREFDEIFYEASRCTRRQWKAVSCIFEFRKSFHQRDTRFF